MAVSLAIISYKHYIDLIVMRMNLSVVLPELIVVGAGPGDPELITLKALKALKKAAVILYDNLINKDLLEKCQRRL
jgi:hypothetical protein